MAKGITLAPCGLIIERIEPAADVLVIMARPAAESAACPTCGHRSDSIQSRYQRTLSDLPSQAKPVRIKVLARRFRCLEADCHQRVFVERLDAAVARPFSRRTSRLEGLVHHPGLALGGRPGQSVARRLLLPVSKDTLLRVVRRRAEHPTTEPRVIGIDDWAWKRGHRYGTIICDLERRCVIDLLADREAGTVTAWLARHPSITVIARDRGAGYRQAATEGRPEAIQVADRWHLMANAGAAFVDAAQRSMAAIRAAFGATPVDPVTLTAAAKKPHTGWLRRREENATIQKMAMNGMGIKEIVRATGRSRGLVRQVVHGGRVDMFRGRVKSLEPFVDALEAAWANGHRNGAALWRMLKVQGFRGALRVVTEWATRKRREASAPPTAVRSRRAPSARRIARMMTSDRHASSETTTQVTSVIANAIPGVTVARDLMDRFHRMIQARKVGDLEGWIADASQGLMASFANGIIQDKDAVAAALTEPWSNGQTEGHNTKLKLAKRQMYGRANLDLLRARLLGAPRSSAAARRNFASEPNFGAESHHFP